MGTRSEGFHPVKVRELEMNFRIVRDGSYGMNL